MLDALILFVPGSFHLRSEYGVDAAMHKRRLDSWKAIADFLGRSLRTVQRWHDVNGLPVHHFGGNKGSVFAYEEEIDAWLAGLAKSSSVSRIPWDKQHQAASRISQELTATADRMWETRAVGNIQTIAELYRMAIENDSTNTSALIGLANALIFGAITEVIEGSIAFPMAIESLRRIPALKSDSVDAKCPLAWLDLVCNRNWRKAHAGFEQVIANRPSSSFARIGLALTNTAIGNLEEAVGCAWEAWRLNPLVRSLGGILCWLAYLTGDFQLVLHLTKQMRTSGGYGPVTGMVEGLVLAQDPNVADKMAVLEKAAEDQLDNPMLQAALGYAYGATGQRGKAQAKQAQLLHWAETSRKRRGYPLALISLGLGEDHDAVSWLETAHTEGCLWTLGFGSDPMLRSLNGHPRFESLLRRIGVPTRCHANSELSCYESPRTA